MDFLNEQQRQQQQQHQERSNSSEQNETHSVTSLGTISFQQVRDQLAEFWDAVNYTTSKEAIPSEFEISQYSTKQHPFSNWNDYDDEEDETSYFDDDDDDDELTRNRTESISLLEEEEDNNNNRHRGYHPPHSRGGGNNRIQHMFASILSFNRKENEIRKRKIRKRRRRNKKERKTSLRPYWLGSGLFLILFSFWILDSLKDPLFGMLCNGDLEKHQPIAKLFSVATTLFIVCFVEFAATADSRREKTNDDSLRKDENKNWTRMQFKEEDEIIHEPSTKNHALPKGIFYYVGIPYILIFFGFAYFLQHFSPPKLSKKTTTTTTTTTGILVEEEEEDNYDGSSGVVVFPKYYYYVGYLLYALIESYGSIAVATFWSYTNSTLSLEDAEDYYGIIIAIAQLGAIGGSSMVAMNTDNYWSNSTLIQVACLIILLHILIMNSYSHRYKPTNNNNNNNEYTDIGNSNNYKPIKATDAADEVEGEEEEKETQQQPGFTTSTRTNKTTNITNDTEKHHGNSFGSGLRLIVKHRYVLLLLGVSCLYEISLTCLDYQLKLLGWNEFENKSLNGDDSNTTIIDTTTKTTKTSITITTTMSFTQFMGHYGQMVNGLSLLFSYVIFPWLIYNYGLKVTIRVFPTALVIICFITYYYIRANLFVLFISMSILKAMTYSVHDPAKEMLYLPTSNIIKFKSKFWIDIVGARIAKAIGSSINTFAGSIDRILILGSAPSFVTSIALWIICFVIGIQFDDLIVTNTVVGGNDDNGDDTTKTVQHYSDNDDQNIMLPIDNDHYPSDSYYDNNAGDKQNNTNNNSNNVVVAGGINKNVNGIELTTL